MSVRTHSLVRKASRFAARHTLQCWLPLRRQRAVISFSFDDVALSACTTGAALLQEYQARATFFVCGGLENQLEQGQLCHHGAQLQQLHRDGHEVACHTYSHLNCEVQPLSVLQADWDRNRQYLAELGIPASGFAFPFGAYDLGSKHAAAQRFSYSRITGGGMQQGRADLHALRAQALYAGKNTDEEIRNLIAQAVEQGAWLIFYSHEVSDQPGPWGTTPAQLRFALQTARDAGCDLLNIRDAIQAYQAVSA